MLKVFKNCFHFYVKSSIHVALAVTCMGALAYGSVYGSTSQNLLIFIFLSTLFVYNFIKYFSIFISSSKRKKNPGLFILLVTSGLLTFGFFFALTNLAKVFVVLGGLLVVLYTIPFFGETSNWRNKKGWKIYLVALSWVLLTVGVPFASSSDFSFSLFMKWFIIQFFYVWVATLPFEIRDSSKDTIHLRTIPQQLGIYKTKKLGFFLLTVALIFTVLVFSNDLLVLAPAFIAFMLLGSALFYCSPQDSNYFTSFWIEGIPIVWWMSFHLISYFY